MDGGKLGTRSSARKRALAGLRQKHDIDRSSNDKYEILKTSDLHMDNSDVAMMRLGVNDGSKYASMHCDQGQGGAYGYNQRHSNYSHDAMLHGMAIGLEGLNLINGGNGASGSNDLNTLYDISSSASHVNGDLRGLSASTACSGSSGSNAGVISYGSTTADLRAAIVSTWLTDHYEPHENISLPRSVLYDHYIEFCHQQQTEPVNSATFGKIIRSVFPMLRTRRLGTRGNSKYHYFGIGLKSALQDSDRFSSIYAQYSRPPPARPRLNRRSITSAGDPCSISGNVLASTSAAASTVYSATSGNLGKGFSSRINSNRKRRGHGNSENLDMIEQQQLANDYKLMNGAFRSMASPNYEDFAHFLEQICTPVFSNVPSQVSFESVQAFSLVYQQHIIDLLRAVSNHEFNLVEGLSELFWLNFPNEMVACLRCDESLRIVAIADDYLYQVLIHTLIPDVLEPMPMTVTQSIRQFAKVLETILLRTLQHPIPQSIVDIKLDSARRFCQVLRRRTSLSHLTQAVRSIISSTEHTTQMLHDWGHVDFSGIREQSDWLMRIKEGMLPWVESTFRNYLQEGSSLHVWASWVETIAEQCIGAEQACGVPLEDACGAVILRWSFYSSMIMRDLTLRSAASFGSFHLLNLLFNEYLLFFVEKKLDDHRRSVGLLAFWPQGQQSLGDTSSLGGLHSGNGYGHMLPSDGGSQQHDRPITGLAMAATASAAGLGGSNSNSMAAGFLFDDFFRKSAVLGPTSSPQPVCALKKPQAQAQPPHHSNNTSNGIPALSTLATNGEGANHAFLPNLADEDSIRFALGEMAAAGGVLSAAGERSDRVF